ncbi:class I SAM-dependent methyltransferase [Microcoleus sp.]|uniref:class I SAM-dependent methyltransferase n=1 Tax=Microcoleus sp. TaxID=44472 RepID=UPI00403ED30C
MPVVKFKEYYNSSEGFDEWSERTGLYPDENYVIQKYLDRGRKTLEAGTGGGRIVGEMKNLGFTSLYGYDFVPEFIERAKQRDSRGSICFEVQDATCLNYEDSSFDQILYLQQLISSIDDETGRTKGVKEAYRILRVGGTAIFSFISFETKTGGVMYQLYLMYLYLLRKLIGSNRSVQYTPLKTSGGAVLLDSGPYLYRYKLQEAYQDLTEVGFKVAAIASREQIIQGIMCDSLAAMSEQPIKGAIYFVCKK